MNKEVILFSVFFGLITCKQDIPKSSASNTEETASMAQQAISNDSYKIV